MGGFLSVVISAMAVWMDLREEAVDNSWVLFSIMAGFLLQLLEKGPKGMIIFLTGAAVTLILLGILFIFRMLGAGDVKILCALGGIMGPRTVTEDSKGGMSYEDYLRVLLIAKGKQEKVIRGMDMIECSIREKGKRPGFRMDHCIVALEASADVKANNKKTFTVTRQYAYE